jgi:uncharacterized membrane protein YhdT
MKNQMKNKNPFLPAIFTLAFLFAPICYLSVAYTINVTRGPISSPDWLTLARIVIYLFAMCCFVSSFLIERHILKKSKDKLIKKGKDPDVLILIIGLALFLAPACIAFFLFIFGGLLTDLYACSILSFVGIIFWSWHQRAVFKIDGENESQIISSEARSYTIILILLGLISLGFLALKIFLIIKPPEYYTAPVSIEIPGIPIYAVMTICSWGTAILRFRRSSYALLATGTISFVYLFWFPFGTAAFIYWIGWIRKKEKPNNALAADS